RCREMWRYVRIRAAAPVYPYTNIRKPRSEAAQRSRSNCVSVILCNSDGLVGRAVATIRAMELPPHGGQAEAVSPAVISIVTVLLDLDAASLTPGRSPKLPPRHGRRRPLSERKRAPHFRRPTRREDR